MAKSPVPTLSDLWGSRREASLMMQRPRSPKVEKKFNFPAANSKEDWHLVTSVVTALFQKKKLSNLELDLLTEKVKLVKADFGNGELCKRFREAILVKGMIILREHIKVDSGAQLLDKLATTWTHFFHNVLPLVQAIFVNLQPADGNSVRDLSLITFRDIVVLKTKLEEAFQMGLPSPPAVVQMLLVLQSVHDSTPPNKNYRKLETLVSYVVSPYLSSSGLRTKPITPYSQQTNTKTLGSESTPSDTGRIPRPASALQLTKTADKLDPVMEVEQANRRHTFTGSNDSVTTRYSFMQPDDPALSVSLSENTKENTKM